MNQRSYILASAYFIVLVIVFQALSMNVDFSGELYSNRYNYTAEAKIRENVETRTLSTDYLLVGQNGDDTFRSIQWMMNSLKKPVRAVAQLAESDLAAAPVGIIVTTSDMGALGDLALVTDYVRAGGQLILARLPDQNAAMTADFLETLGILSIGNTVTYEQCELYEGLLLGGMVRYEELPLTARRLDLSSLCKVWATMWLGDPIYRDDVVPLVYERRLDSGVIAVVNGAFLSDIDGIGILSALLALNQDAFITPAVNAATLSLVNFPYLEGDTQILASLYARNAFATNQALIWPDLSHVLLAGDMRATAFLPVGVNGQNEAQVQLISFLMRALSELNSELGLMEGFTGIETLQENFPNYEYFATYGETPAEGSRVVVREVQGTDDDFALLGGDVVRYPALTTGYNDSEAVNLSIRGFASGLFMIHHAVDLAPPIRLASNADNWQELNRPLSRLVSSAVRPYPKMARLKASEALQNMLRYTLSTPEYTFDDQGVTIDSGISDTSYFLLRTRKSIASTEGLTLTELEDDVYLVRLSGRQGRVVFGGAKR